MFSRLLGHLVRLDLRIFRLVARSHTPWLDRVLPLLSRAADNSRLWMAVATLLALAGRRSGKRAALRGTGSIALTSATVNQVVKRLVRRPRPDLRRVPAVRRLDVQPLTTSFPSGHAASAAAFTAAVAAEKPRVVPPIAAVAAAVGYSRVYVGVHYPFDVVAGAAAGAGVALLTGRLWPVLPPEAARSVPAGERVELPARPDGESVTVVVNPASGSSNGRTGGLRTALPRARVVEADAGRLRERLAAAATESEIVGICGGDGSVAAAAQAALERNRPLLLVPGGTLDHLARDLALEHVDASIEALRRGDGRWVDVAEVAGRAVINGVGFGAYVAMIDARAPLEPRVGRWPAQLFAFIRTLAAARPFEVRVDGRPRRVWTAFVGNCRHEPAGLAPSWRPRLDDGTFDVRLALAERRFSRLRLLGALLTGRLERSAAFQRWSAPSVALEADAPMRLAADGDPFDAGRSVTIEKRGRLRVYAAAGL